MNRFKNLFIYSFISVSVTSFLLISFNITNVAEIDKFEKMLPINVIKELTVDNSSLNNDENQREKSKQIILLPYTYVIQLGSKNFRTKLFLAINYWLKVSDENLKIVIDIIEMLHNGSLVLDDIEDNSMTRRGRPAAHLIFGVPLCINAGCYVLIQALDMILKRFPSNLIPEATKLFTDNILECHIGQGLELYWRDSYICPTEKQYLYMIEGKTGGLFRLGVRLLQLFTDSKVDYMPFTKHLGQYFQIKDDYANLNVEDYHKAKGFAEDLSEGKFSFPIVHAVSSKPEDITILSILKQRNDISVDTKKYIISLLNEFGSMSYTRETCERLDKECREMVANLGDNPLMCKVLDMLLII